MTLNAQRFIDAKQHLSKMSKFKKYLGTTTGVENRSVREHEHNCQGSGWIWRLEPSMIIVMIV